MSFYSIKISEIKSRKKGKKLCVITFSKRLRENLGKKVAFFNAQLFIEFFFNGYKIISDQI